LTYCAFPPRGEHFDINTKNTFPADKALRQAIFTVADRNDITKTVACSRSPLGNVHLSQKGYTDDRGQAGRGDVPGPRRSCPTPLHRMDAGKLVNAVAAVPTFRFRHTGTARAIRRAVPVQMKKTVQTSRSSSPTRCRRR
jgi:hypothetical protein